MDDNKAICVCWVTTAICLTVLLVTITVAVNWNIVNTRRLAFENGYENATSTYRGDSNWSKVQPARDADDLPF